MKSTELDYKKLIESYLKVEDWRVKKIQLLHIVLVDLY